MEDRMVVPTTSTESNSTSNIFVCRICHTAGSHPRFTGREMMFGTRATFEYFQCNSCGCLQITEIPKNLGDFYGHAYYSFAKNHAVAYRYPVKNLLNRWRDLALLFLPGGDRLPFRVSVPYLRVCFEALRRVPQLSLRSKIIDVGCGNGELLYRLHNAGFRSLTGVDPFLDADRQVDAGFRLLRLDAANVDGVYDVVIMNHSFEHVPEPNTTMHAVAKLLAQRGIAVIRVPLADSEAWERYRGDWFQLDAPRHLHLHTVRSLCLLAERAGLEVCRVVHDSDHHQFTVSERYRRDVPFASDPLRGDGKPSNVPLSKHELNKFQALAKRLNREGRGDQAIFYLRHRAGGSR